MRIKFYLFFGLLACLTIQDVAAHSTPKDKRGSNKYRKEGVHNGNMVETIFYNFGEVAWWGRSPSGVWPKGSEHSYMDGITPLVATEVEGRNNDTIYMCEAGYRELMDISPDGKSRGWEPRPGYAKYLGQDKIAMSDDPNSWPSSWADKDSDWDGYWNGYFGKRTNADQESFFVMDDDADDGHDFYPDSNDHTRRGLGLNVSVRGFQWSNALAEDLIFWHYNIKSEATYVYEKIVFGMYVDVGVGGQMDSNDDNASFDIEEDITYSWDSNKLGEGGWGPTGWCGYAFLESPGNPYDKIDNDGDCDEDGNPVITAAMLLGEIPGNGKDDNGNGVIDEGEAHIGLKYADGVDNDGDGLVDEMIDESRDDLLDNDGDWDAERDDVGEDGLAGTGDKGEGDGLPTTGEPNYDATDKDESDQIGLTAFDVFYIGSGVTFYKDREIWDRISNSHFDTKLQNGNIAFMYGSGPFPLKPLARERFSVCLVFGEDLADITRNKKTVQDIYNLNYNFARPPEKPKVRAVAGNGKVTLYWDSKAEESYDPVAEPHYDFEGYKIYKSTDPGFLDARTITNAYGEKTFLKPVARFDLRNDVEGFFPLDYQGVKLYMGDNVGLKHSWVDNDVMNGKTYYYAVVSYDRGNAAVNMYPSECTRLIVRDINGNIQLDDNTVTATPAAPAAGFENGGLVDSIERVKGFGTGALWVDFVDPLKIKDEETYEIEFDDELYEDSLFYRLTNVTDPDLPRVVIDESFHVRGEDGNPMFNGARLFVYDDEIEWDMDNTGWVRGESNLAVVVEKKHMFPKRREGYPSSYEVRFGDRDTSWWYIPKFPVNFSVWDVYENKKARIALEEPDETHRDSLVSPGDYLRVILMEGNTPREIWRINFIAPQGNDEIILPDSGDVLSIGIKTPFRKGDVFRFKTKAPRVQREKAVEELDDIAVVPNPYVAAARWESTRLMSTGRGERKIYFIHLPRSCRIRIYTIAGDHVQTLDHDEHMLNGSEAWDLKTKDGLDAAPGIYIFHVDAPGIGEKIDRFAIIK